MYMQNDIATVAAPVFHIDAPCVDPARRRAEIERVIEIATAAIPKAQMKKLGSLTLAAARDDDDYTYFAQIRSEPIGTSGVEYRFPMPAGATGENDLALTAAELVEGAVHIARTAGKLKDLVAIVREFTDEALQPAKGGIVAMRLVAIGITPGQSGQDAKVTLDVEMLGDDLTMNVERASDLILSGGLERLEDKIKDFAARHIARRKLLAQARVAGASGWIDDSALRILDHSGVGRAAALDMLRRDRQVNFSFGGESGYDLMGGVYWDDGVVRGYVECRDYDNTFRLEAKVLTVKSNGLPATVVASLIGRSLGEVIEIPYIPANALIVEVEESGDWLYLRLEIGRSLIEEAIGTRKR